MTGTIRVLDEADKPVLMQFLARDPVTNLFVASRVNAHGVAPGYMASTIFGYHVAGELAACCLMGGNLVPIGDAPGSMQAFVEAIGSRSVVGSIMGEAPLVPPLAAIANAVHDALGKRFYALPMSPPRVAERLEQP